MTDLLERPAIRRQATRWSVADYHRLRDLGLAPVRSELLDGVIIDKMTKSPLHTLIVHRLQAALAVGLPDGFQLRKEDPLSLATSEPEPDIAIVAGSDADFREHHPHTARLVVEVAISSEELDRAKAGLYDAAGIEVYWLILPASLSCEVYSEPTGMGYRQVEICGPGGLLRTWYGAGLSVDALFA